MPVIAIARQYRLACRGGRHGVAGAVSGSGGGPAPAILELAGRQAFDATHEAARLEERPVAERLVRPLREVQRGDAPVGGIGTALDEPRRLEAVHQVGGAGGPEGERRAQAADGNVAQIAQAAQGVEIPQRHAIRAGQLALQGFRRRHRLQVRSQHPPRVRIPFGHRTLHCPV